MRAEHCRDDSELAAFLDHEFDQIPGLLGEYPLLVGSQSDGESWVIRSDGAVVAHTAWCRMTLRCGAEQLPAAGIGLVTTARTHRGRGLASTLIKTVVERARDEACALALLFSPPRSLYASHGFVPCGRERLTLLRPGTGPAKGSRPARADDVPALAALLALQPVGVVRNVSDFSRLLSIPRTQAHVVERNGRIVAYCVVGKGRDLQGIAHEWAGEPDAVAELLGSLAASEPLYALSPASLAPPAQGEHVMQPVAQVCVLDAARLGDADPVRVFGSPCQPARMPLYVWGLDSF